MELANDINRHMPEYVVRRLEKGLAQRESLDGAEVVLVGMAYKPNTSDARESPAVGVAERLIDLGATVRVVDPHIDHDAMPAGSVEIDLTADELRSAEAVIVLVDHDDVDLDLLGEHSGYVLDCRDVLHGATVDKL